MENNQVNELNSDSVIVDIPELTDDYSVYVPDTISDEWKEQYSNYPDPRKFPRAPSKDNLDAWKALQESFEEQSITQSVDFIKQLGANYEYITIDGVPVIDIKPKGWVDNGKVVLYMHGGAYTLLSAESTLGTASLFSDSTGLRVISIDYTLAPYASWLEVTDQVISVIKSLNKQGINNSNIVMFGESSGGALASSVTLKIRDNKMELPGAVVMWSPWSDITETGDSYQTLKNEDPTYLYDTILKPSADAYAEIDEQKHPYISPVYGDYTKGFPPTLIQGGTKEIFLSNFVRHYQAIDDAGQIVKLDLYEGMTHIFQAILPHSEESKKALIKVNRFLEEYFRS